MMLDGSNNPGSAGSICYDVSSGLKKFTDATAVNNFFFGFTSSKMITSNTNNGCLF